MGSKRNRKYTPLDFSGFEYLKKYSKEFYEIIARTPMYSCKFNFPNGYGASVIKSDVSYGNRNDLFELAVLRNGVIVYDTEITDDVIGYLDNDTALEIVDKIYKLDEGVTK